MVEALSCGDLNSIGNSIGLYVLFHWGDTIFGRFIGQGRQPHPPTSEPAQLQPDNPHHLASVNAIVSPLSTLDRI
jgi:hypothetical protein